MKLLRSFRKYRRLRRRSQQQASFLRSSELYARTQAFVAASSVQARIRAFRRLFVTLWAGSSERVFAIRLIRWIRLVEEDTRLRAGFEEACQSMIAALDSTSLFAEAGLPAHHGIFTESVRRIVQQFLPPARPDSDTVRLLVSLFATRHDVERFLALPDYLFARLCALFWPAEAGSFKAAERVERDLRQALCLMASRISGRGLSGPMRERGGGSYVEASPFYQLIFVTEKVVRAEPAALAACLGDWKTCAARCREELEIVHLNMEQSGVSSDLVLDLRSIEMTLTRMGHLVEQIESSLSGGPAHIDDRIDVRTHDRIHGGIHDHVRATRVLLNELVDGCLEDKRLRSLLGQSLTLLARKTVEHTGRSGEHYIAQSNKEYWQMWAAAAGGGLLTVLTAAIKMRILEQSYPLFVEGFLSSMDYAVSFVLLQVFGLALATKQPSATAATLAGIVRRNRGHARWSKISDFTARITRTQLAAAVSNVIAVSAGAIALERLWRIMFSQSYLPEESARHVYETLHPLASGTIPFAAVTGILLWLAALIGGWCENFATYHRLPAAIAQHPLGARVGARSMRRAGYWVELNLAGWSTSIALGFLLGFAPVLCRFFGIPMEVRHVTLSTGTFALAAARFGAASFGHGWFYYAAAGIGVTFVLNLGVSFLIAAFVALRAYDVRGKEQRELLGFLLGQIVHSPLKFLIPVEGNHAPASSLTELQEKE